MFTTTPACSNIFALFGAVYDLDISQGLPVFTSRQPESNRKAGRDKGLSRVKANMEDSRAPRLQTELLPAQPGGLLGEVHMPLGLLPHVVILHTLAHGASSYLRTRMRRSFSDWNAI